MDFLNLLLVSVVFLTMISLLVAAHEYGHYLFARMFGMGVEEFSIGFGKPVLVTWLRRWYTIPLGPDENPRLDSTANSVLEGKTDPNRVELIEEPGKRRLRERTDFTIRPIPIGGFVRIKGMMPEEDASEVNVPGGFYNSPPWQRLLVLFAGPLFSLIAGIAILIPLAMFNGVSEVDRAPVLGSLNDDKPGYKAGLRKGDRVLAIDDTPIRTFYDMASYVRDRGGETLQFRIQRGDAQRTIAVIPELDKEPSTVLNSDFRQTDVRRRQGRIGAWPNRVVRKLGVGEATARAVSAPLEAVGSIVKLAQRPQNASENIGGPGSMVAATGAAVQLGIAAVLELSAVLSISLGIMNLLPAPPLDGGQMVIAFVEMLRGGKRLSFRVQTAAGTLGFLFVVLLMLTAISADAQRFLFRG